MTTFNVNGNFVGWASEGSLGTINRDTGLPQFNPRAHSWAGFVGITNAGIGGSVIMPSDGKITGIVVFVEQNDALFDTLIHVNINAVNIGAMTITIPPGGTGYFFSGPDVAEVSREFLRGDKINFDTFKNVSETIDKGTDFVTAMFCAEIAFEPVIP